MSFLKKLFGGDKPQPATDPPFLTEASLSRVYPRIKGLYSDEHPVPQPAGPVMDFPHADTPVLVPLAEGLGISYALDEGDHFLFIQNGHLNDTITLEKLHAAALKNLEAAAWPQTKFHGDAGNVLMLTNGGNYEAAMLLLNSVWDSLDPTINDTICVAVPARDLLFIAGKNNEEGREGLRHMVRFYFDENETAGLLVRHIYERKDEGWAVIETA